MILVTGATGFIGRHVMEALLSSVPSSRIRLIRSELEKETRKPFPNVETVYADLSNKRALYEAAQHVDTIIHLASKNIDRDQSGFRTVNVEGTRNLCAAAVEAKVQKCIYLSSVGVYGHAAHCNSDETETVQPDTAFSQSKADAEQVILAHTKAGHFQGVILRHRFVYGRGDRYVIPQMIKAAKKYPFLISGGKAKMSLILADDLARLIIRFASEKNRSHQRGGAFPVYHATDGCPITYREALFTICDIYGIEKPKRSIPFSLLYGLIRLQEQLCRMDPETRTSSLSSIRLKLIGHHHYFSNTKLTTFFPDFQFTPFKQGLEQAKDHYTQFV